MNTSTHLDEVAVCVDDYSADGKLVLVFGKDIPSAQVRRLRGLFDQIRGVAHAALYPRRLVILDLTGPKDPDSLYDVTSDLAAICAEEGYGQVTFTVPRAA